MVVTRWTLRGFSTSEGWRNLTRTYRAVHSTGRHFLAATTKGVVWAGGELSAPGYEVIVGGLEDEPITPLAFR